MSIVLNEREWVLERLKEPSLSGRTGETLIRLTKFYSAGGLNKTEIKRKLEEYLILADPSLSPQKRSKTLDRIVKKYKGVPLINIEYVPVCKEELGAIAALKGEQAKRLAFTLLCLAKYQKEVNLINDYWVCLKESEIMSLANINTSIKRRCAMFSYLKEQGLIEFSRRVDNTNVRVSFVSDSEPILKIDDFRNLGYQYMMYSKKPYFKCSACGITTRYSNPNVGRKQLYCKDCAKKIAYNQRLVFAKNKKTEINEMPKPLDT